MRKMLPLPWERAGERVLLVLLLVTSFPALANGLDDFLAFNASTKTASGSFEQQAFDRSGKVVDRSSGSLAFARPGKFRWVYDKPHKQVLVADGTKLWIYDPDLAQVTVKRIGQAISSTPAALLAGRDDITQLFTLRDAGSKDGLEWVEAQPKAKDTGFDRVRLGLKGKTLAAMELYDQLGGHTVLRFSDFRANAPLLPGNFEFTPPKGVDVIDEDASKK